MLYHQTCLRRWSLTSDLGNFLTNTVYHCPLTRLEPGLGWCYCTRCWHCRRRHCTVRVDPSAPPVAISYLHS